MFGYDIKSLRSELLCHKPLILLEVDLGLKGGTSLSYRSFRSEREIYC